MADHGTFRDQEAAWYAGEQDVKCWETTQEGEAVKQTDISSKTRYVPGSRKPWGLRQGSSMIRSLCVRKISRAAIQSVHRQARGQEAGSPVRKSI